MKPCKSKPIMWQPDRQEIIVIQIKEKAQPYEEGVKLRRQDARIFKLSEKR
jgi:hypothetical protein